MNLMDDAEYIVQLLAEGATIQTGDEIVSDCGTAWLPVPKWAVGMEYKRGTFKVMRRTAGVLGTSPDQQEQPR